MKSRFILTILVILFIFCGFLWAQDPEGELDYFYIVCGVNGYPGSGTAEVCFQLRFHSDNTGINKLCAVAAAIIITGNNLVSVDTTQSKAFAGSVAESWVDFDDGDKAVYKADNQDPTVSPFHMLYAAHTFRPALEFTGDSLLANICLTINDTGTICIDTMATETVDGVIFGTGGSQVQYYGGWSGPFCCQVVLCQEKAGDANNDGMVNIGDIIYNVNHVFKGGAAPSVFCQGNVNADNKIDLADIIYEVNYVFKGGSAPLNTDLCCL